MNRSERQKALAEFQRTQDILLLQHLLGHKHLRSTVKLLVREMAS
jgi:hypothetical protein